MANILAQERLGAQAQRRCRTPAGCEGVASCDPEIESTTNADEPELQRINPRANRLNEPKHARPNGRTGQRGGAKSVPHESSGSIGTSTSDFVNLRSHCAHTALALRWFSFVDSSWAKPMTEIPSEFPCRSNQHGTESAG
jgi:hypothetical protein